MFDMLLCVLWQHTSHGRPETQTDPIATANVDPVMVKAPKGFKPSSRPPLRAFYHPTSVRGALMWFRKT